MRDYAFLLSHGVVSECDDRNEFLAGFEAGGIAAAEWIERGCAARMASKRSFVISKRSP